MITRIETLNYKCLRYVSQPLSPFQVLVGENASGKSTFLDVLVFLGDIVRDGVEPAVRKRARSLKELMWQGAATCVEFAIEFDLRRNHDAKENREYSYGRYEISVSTEEKRGIVIDRKQLSLNHLRRVLTNWFPPDNTP